MTITYSCTWYRQVPGLLIQLRRILGGLASQVSVLWKRGSVKTQMTSSQQMSVLFTDVMGFSSLMPAWPLEVVVSSLDTYFERLGRCVYRYGGQVDKFMGDGMLAVFESPHDAVRAAWAILREVAAYNAHQTQQARCSFPTRIVVDTGLIIKTAIGLHRDRDWTVLGPAVNTASHLAKVLPPGRVFISYATYCLLSGQNGPSLTEGQATDGCGGDPVVYEVSALSPMDCSIHARGAWSLRASAPACRRTVKSPPLEAIAG
jgi:class 3 adenylate cyclase